MHLTERCGLVGTLTAIVLTVGAGTSQAQQGPLRPESAPPASQRLNMLENVRFDQNLDARLPLDLPFVDETGRTVRLGDYFGERPVILALVYYECPMLCTQVLNGLVSALGVLDFDAGRDFDVVALSFDPGESAALASAKKDAYMARYGRPGTEGGWHFLTGAEADIRQVTDAVGFEYAYDPAIDQYAHAAGITLLTPDGRVSRYFFGIEYAPRDLRLGLVETAEGRIGSVVDQVLLFCYHYDPTTGKYGLLTMNLVRGAGVLFLLALGTFWVVSWRSERRSRAESAEPPAPVHSRS